MSWAELEDEVGWLLIVIVGGAFLVVLWPLALAEWLSGSKNEA